MTTAKTADDLKVGDRVKFGKDDFRTIAYFYDPGWGSIWMAFDPDTVPAGACSGFDIRSRESYRVAV